MEHRPDHAAQESTELPFRTDMNRRDFLGRMGLSLVPQFPVDSKKGVISESVIASLSQCLGLSEKGNEAILARSLPYFKTSKARETFRGWFGFCPEKKAPIPLESYLTLMSVRIVKENPLYYLSKCFDQPDDVSIHDELFAAALRGANPDEEDRVLSAFRKLQGRRGSDFSYQKWLLETAKASYVMDSVTYRVQECIFEEIYELEKPNITALVRKEIRRQSIMSPAVHDRDWDDYWIDSIGRSSLKKSLFQDDRNEHLELCTDDAMQSALRQMSNQESEMYIMMKEAIKKQVPASAHVIQLVQRRMQELNELDVWEKFSQKHSSTDGGDHSDSRQGAIAQVMQELQLPLQRLMSQIQLLGDQNYERKWETPTASLPQTQQAPQDD